MQDILGHYNGAPFSDDAGTMPLPAASSHISRSQSMFDELSRPMRMLPSELARLRYDERRQGSDTFQNLGKLEEPLTMQRWIIPLLGNLQRQGTKTIGQFLRPGRTEERSNYPLRRSKTAPDNTSYGPVDAADPVDIGSAMKDENVSDDIGVRHSLGNVLRRGPYRGSSAGPSVNNGSS